MPEIIALWPMRGASVQRDLASPPSGLGVAGGEGSEPGGAVLREAVTGR
jgi:hypothetical protein